jgi:ABC-type lipoprotein release transport system permease subunit
VSPEKVWDVIRDAVPDLDFAVERGRGWGKLVSERGAVQVNIAGIDVARERGLSQTLRFVEGSLADLELDTVVLFASHAKKLGVKKGDALTISAQTTRGAPNAIDCTVAAIAEDVGLLSQWNVIVANDTLRELLELRPDVTGAIQLYLKAPESVDLKQRAEALRGTLAAAGFSMMDSDPRPYFMKYEDVIREDWTGQKLDVTSWADEVSFLMWMLQSLSGLTFVLMAVLSTIIVAGVSNTAWISIRERTREIGMLRAIGMSRWHVVRVLVLQSTLLAFLAALIGAGLGSGLASFINQSHVPLPVEMQAMAMSRELYLSVVAQTFVTAVVLMTAVSGLGVIAPALRAARLRPALAMSHFS